MKQRKVTVNLKWKECADSRIRLMLGELEVAQILKKGTFMYRIIHIGGKIDKEACASSCNRLDILMSFIESRLGEE